MARGRHILPWGGPGGAFTPPAHATPVTIPTVTSVTPASDRYPSGGASVTITGTNFVAGAAVLFGTQPATSVVVVNSTTITCNTPAQTAPGQYDITVTVNGQSGVLVAAFTYVTGFITSISPNFSPQPGLINAVVKGINFVTGSTVTIGGVAATTAFVDSQTFFVVIPGPHALGFVDVTVTDPSGTQTTLRNGFQYTLLNRGEDIRRSQPEAQTITTQLGQPATASFAIDGQSNTPVVGEKIILKDLLNPTNVLFGGTITNVEQDYEEQGNQLVWKCQAIDFTFLLNKYRPFGRFDNVSATEAVTTLVKQYAAQSFTTNHVQTNLAPVSLYFDGSQDFATCLSQIAAAIGGGHWYVDANMDVHFFHIQAPNLAQLPGVVPGGVQITVSSQLDLLQNIEAIGSPVNAQMVLVT